jgi:hypothetical protein
MKDSFPFGRKTDRGWEFTDRLEMQVVDVEKSTNSSLKDDYPGAFKPPIPGQVHPTGLGLIPDGAPQQQNSTAKGLVTRIAATHSGLITRNNGFYMPDKMRAAVSSWTDIYPKPVQVHHDDHDDAVGRVMSARYVETTAVVADKFKNHVLRDSQKRQVGYADAAFWDKLNSPKISFHEKLQLLKLVDSVLQDKHYRGTGYIELTCDIVDAEAIKKVQNGIFLTVSVGAMSDKAVCSVCNTNWIEEEHCGHRPGKMYDGKMCYVIAGNLEYDEVSFVNTPADRHATILAIESNIQDSLKTDSLHNYFFLPIADNFEKEESPMDIKDKKEGEETPDVTTEVVVKTEVPDPTKIEDTKEETPEQKFTKLLDSVLDNGDISITSDEEVALYDAMMAEVISEEEFKDSKLSSEARSKLPKSSFCGPNRTFPVIDSAHYVAAKSLIAKHKEDEAKSKVLSSIERKGKALGFTVPKKVKVADAVVPAPVVVDNRITADLVVNLVRTLDEGLYGRPWDGQEEKTLTDEEANQIRNLILSLSKRLGKDSMEKFVVDTGLAVASDALAVQVEEAIKLEDSLAQKADQLDALRQELRASYADIVTLQDQLVDANTKLREQKIARLEGLSVLDGQVADAVKTQFLELNDESLDNSLETLMKKVDINKIADKVNNGLSRTPEEIVENPLSTGNEPSAGTRKDTIETKTAFHTQDQVDRIYRHYMLVEKNPEKARAFYSEMVKTGKASPKT